MYKMYNKKFKVYLIIVLTSLLAGLSCKKLIEIQRPVNELIAADVFKDSSSAISALLNIYSQFGNSGGSIEGYYVPYLSLYADELFPINGNPGINEYYNNSIKSDNTTNSAAWSRLYFVVYECNALLEGVENNSKLSPSLVNKLTGETKFLRAFSYFLLVNTYGDVPLVLTTDVTISASLPRTLVAAVYSQIFEDLTDAVEKLDKGYENTEKIRANKYAAEALLAKVNLYNKNWSKAENLASEVINSGFYTPLETPENVFLKNSTGTILQIFEKYGNTWGGNYFLPFFGTPNYGISSSLLNDFGNGDLRKVQWIDSIDNNGSIVYYPYKYKNSSYVSVNDGEYTMCLRIAEQYLIRAEARCENDKIESAVEDVNIVRGRAGLSPIVMPISKDSCLYLILDERRKELFTEWGNRFFDLKRTGRINDVLGAVKDHWQASDSLFPVPQVELGNNPFLTQNSGY